ncbi:hypothetical protein K7X08_029545 [Anisodus acutangulus]|uniref:Uncharacterized protein n=1 Tax=Anisodus acutangulus TaxID=402998 RepID=A0A9Q1L374_9SOLA|nr:hypothetical protein K7X08_029545 [Anisodus acutangulus]
MIVKLWRVLVLVSVTHGVKHLRDNVIVGIIVLMYVQMKGMNLEGNVCGKGFLGEWLACVSILADSN